MAKHEIRVLGIDDAPFDKFRDSTTKVIGLIYRGGQFPDGVVSTTVSVDGTDSTSSLVDMINSCKFRDQLRAVLLKGIAVAGFNIIDISALSERTGIPVIVVMRSEPRIIEMVAALEKLGLTIQRDALQKAGEIHKTGKLLFQCAGCFAEEAVKIIALTTAHGNLPEPLRVAHLVAGGITTGESRGRA
ncbi:MAG: DUF99 family protein [Nanoarchaeota archaeon]